jgi:hypothetical protein
MGQLHNELRRTALSRALKAALGDTRADGGLERYGETLQPVMDLWALPEWAHERKEILGADARLQGAVAAQFGAYGVGIPPAGEVICVVDAMKVMSGVATLFTVERLTHAALAAAVATLAFSIVTRDRRNGDFVAGVELFSGTSATPTLGAAIENIRVVANDEHTTTTATPYVVVPGQAIVVIGQTANQAQNCSLKLRARQRLRTERG